MKDWKAVVTPYPAHLHRADHTRACRTAHIALAVVAVSCLFLVGGYAVGRQDGLAEQLDHPLAGMAVSAEQCERSDDYAEVLEHTWTHAGRVIVRECIRVERPHRMGPNRAVQTPARTM